MDAKEPADLSQGDSGIGQSDRSDKSSVPGLRRRGQRRYPRLYRRLLSIVAIPTLPEPKSAMKIPILDLSNFPTCQYCGKPVFEPGLCQTCAYTVASVDRVMRVVCQVPDERLLQPEDLMEHEKA